MSGIAEAILSEFLVKLLFKSINFAKTIAQDHGQLAETQRELHTRLMAQIMRFEAVAKLLADNHIRDRISSRHRHTIFNIARIMHRSMISYLRKSNCSRKETLISNEAEMETLFARLEQSDTALSQPSDEQQSLWLRLKDKVSFAVFRKQRLEKLVVGMEKWGDCLDSCVSPMVMLIMSRHNCSIDEMVDIASTTEQLDTNIMCKMLIERRRLEKEIDSNIAIERPEAALRLDPSQIHLLDGDIRLYRPFTGDENDPERSALGGRFRREWGEFGGEHVIVEFKQRPVILANENDSQSRILLNSLVRELRMGSRVKTFLVLDCLGYYESETVYGILYRPPPGQVKCLSLANILLHPEYKALLHDNLQNRIDLAKALATTLYHLHAVQWVHKSLNPDNILIFATAAPNGVELIDWSRPYLVGFDLSRTNQGYSNMSPPEIRWETAAYVHPVYRRGHSPDTRKRFKRSFDLYSLGVLLLEIGILDCFKHSKYRLNSEWSELKSYDLQQKYIGQAKAMKGDLGPKYSELVVKCLSGAFNFNEAEEDENETCLLEAFRAEVCEKLDQICV
jgi:hypothetical protein